MLSKITGQNRNGHINLLNKIKILISKSNYFKKNTNHKKYHKKIKKKERKYFKQKLKQINLFKLNLISQKILAVVIKCFNQMMNSRYY